MGNSLYEISSDIQNIFAEVEEAEGEITDEQLDLLEIKQDELKTKLESYYKAIKVWGNEAAACKSEKSRINDVQNKYKNRVERLKKSMLTAVEMFGTEGKTNKFIELPTIRLSTRTSKTIEPKEQRIKDLIDILGDYIYEGTAYNVLGNDDEPDYEGIINVINANYKAKLSSDEEFIPFTVDDLRCLILNINRNITVYDLLKNCTLIKMIYENITFVHVDNATAKEDYKKYPNTLSEEKVTQSLIIK